VRTQLHRPEGGKGCRFEDSSNPFGLLPAGPDTGAANEPATPAPHQQSRHGVEGLRDRRQGIYRDRKVADIGSAGSPHLRQPLDQIPFESWEDAISRMELSPGQGIPQQNRVRVSTRSRSETSGSLRSLPSPDRSERSSPTWANRSSRRRSRRLGARRPTRQSSARPMTIAKRFRCRPTSCPRSTSTAPDRCRTPGHDKAARPPDSECLRTDTGKTPSQGEGRREGNGLLGPGDISTRLTSRSSVGQRLRKCH